MKKEKSHCALRPIWNSGRPSPATVLLPPLAPTRARCRAGRGRARIAGPLARYSPSPAWMDKNGPRRPPGHNGVTSPSLSRSSPSPERPRRHGRQLAVATVPPATSQCVLKHRHVLLSLLDHELELEETCIAPIASSSSSEPGDRRLKFVAVEPAPSPHCTATTHCELPPPFPSFCSTDSCSEPYPHWVPIAPPPRLVAGVAPVTFWSRARGRFARTHT